MNKGIVRIIIVLAAAVLFSGCSSMGAERPILSAAEAQSKISFSVTVQEPADDIISPDMSKAVAFVD